MAAWSGRLWWLPGALALAAGELFLIAAAAAGTGRPYVPAGVLCLVAGAALIRQHRAGGAPAPAGSGPGGPPSPHVPVVPRPPLPAPAFPGHAAPAEFEH
jgi:hypothetical protein